MRNHVALMAVLLGLVFNARLAHAWAEERIGPDSQHRYPTVEQPHWPANFVHLLRRESRVYSRWVNGSQAVYFDADPDEIRAIIQQFSDVSIRDHELRILAADNERLESFRGKRIAYNVFLFLPSKMSRFVDRLRGRELRIYEPTLRVYLDPRSIESLSGITLPDNIITVSEISGLPIRGKATKPERQPWHVKPNPDGGGRVTMWRNDVEHGISIGRVQETGYFEALFSDQEIADLKSGASWLTRTAGGWKENVKRDDERLGVELLFRGRIEAAQQMPAGD